MNAAEPFPPIEKIPPHLYEAALQLILGPLPPDERRERVAELRRSLETGEISAEGLVGAVREGRPVGATLAQIQPGRTAILWPPRVVAEESFETALRLLSAVCRYLEAQRVRMAQAMLPVDAASDEVLLCRGGFEFLADLLYLVSVASEFPRRPPDTPLEFETYSPASHDRFMRVIEATYAETLDCPPLEGVREIEDVLAGYRSIGEAHATQWLIVRHGEDDVGCLLLADHPRHGNVELVYMGIVPGVRGHGWGRHIARHAQWLAREAGRSRLVLAVDAANRPAVALYAAEGFQIWDRRRVFLRRFPAC